MKDTGNRRWRIMFLFFLCYTVLYMARGSMSIVGKPLMEYYNWSNSQYGLVSTAFFLGYMSTMVFGGSLADKIGGGKVLCVGAILWSLFVFLTPIPLSWGFAALVLMIVVRALCGMSQGVALPSMTSMIAKWVPKSESAIAQGITLIGVAMGLAVTFPLGAWVMNTWSWQMVFWSFAFLGPIWVLIWWKFGYTSPEQDPHISKSELDFINQSKAAAAASASQVSADDPDQKLTIKEAYGMSAVWTGALSMLATHYLFYLFMTWLPTYFANGRGLPLTQSAFSAMMPYVCAMITYPLGGGLADWCSRKWGDNIGRKVIPIVGLMLAAILLYFATKAESTFAATTLVSLSNGALCLTMGGYYSIPIVFSRKHAGKLVGIWSTFASIGGIIAPTVTGIFVDKFGYDFALVFGAAMAFVAAILLLFVRVAPFGEIIARRNAAANA